MIESQFSDDIKGVGRPAAASPISTCGVEATFYARLSERMWVSAAWSIQVSGPHGRQRKRTRP